MKTCMAIAVASLAICTSVGSAAENRELTGRVTRIIDGDSLELLVAGEEPLSFRLNQTAAPEKSQPYGDRATKALAALILGKRVRVEVVALDRYGRTVGEIYIGDTHVNAEMVRRGHAWAYTRYVETLAIVELEDEARKHERGLWQLPLAERDAPWVWRHRRRGLDASQPEVGRPDTVCADKRTCREMVGCAEARFYLLECGLTRLDGDGDGIPCESKCRE